MLGPPQTALALYFSSALVFAGAFGIHADPPEDPIRPLERAHARGEVEPGVPRLDPADPMANRAVLMEALDAVVAPGGDDDCHAAARTVALGLGGRLSRVRFGASIVCQLLRLKQISVAQPGFGRRGLAEVAAFVLGRRSGRDVDVTRIVVPPFRFTGATLALVPADLGPLGRDEQLIGTYHTHPDDDWHQGLLSRTDLRFMRAGFVDFHGHVGPLVIESDDVDWLFDIVEPRVGDWNVFAHDRDRLRALDDECESDDRRCPLESLRLPGTRYYLLARYYEVSDRR
jgi:proteasome lid subunit RPN8/RPN11